MTNNIGCLFYSRQIFIISIIGRRFNYEKSGRVAANINIMDVQPTSSLGRHHPGFYRQYSSSVKAMYGDAQIDHWTCCYRTDHLHPGCRSARLARSSLLTMTTK